MAGAETTVRVPRNMLQTLMLLAAGTVLGGGGASVLNKAEPSVSAGTVSVQLTAIIHSLDEIKTEQRDQRRDLADIRERTARIEGRLGASPEIKKAALESLAGAVAAADR